MSREQRFFLVQRLFVVTGLILLLQPYVSRAEDRQRIADDKISLVVPDGWEESDLNAGVVEAGFATQDKRTSAFITKYSAATRASMQELMDMTIASFEKEFTIRKESDSVTGQVQGPGEKKWPAIFKTLEATVTKRGDEFEMRFYLLFFDVGSQLYLLQATTTIPVRESREKQVYELIRSLVAKP
ncbi:MAG: hypothetical protein P1U85_08255 [Verrucomicrobiales bacterium]|jgi:hypothetical protein|nr:hypothetical protein [Verrucomicrobiales bacterium]